MKRNIAFTMLVGLIVIFFAAAAFSTSEAFVDMVKQGGLSAKFTEIEGDVQARASESDNFSSASVGQTLSALGQVQTGANSRARLDLSSGTIIRISPSSLFTLASNQPASEGGLLTNLQLAFGELWISLNGGEMNVETPSGVAAVQGSHMSISITPQMDSNGNTTYKVTTTCFEGNCSLTNSSGQLVKLISGQAAEYVINSDGSVTNITQRDMTEEEIDEWLTIIEDTNVRAIAFATMTAAAASPTPKIGGGGGNTGATVPNATNFDFGSFALKPKFTIGAAQIKILSPDSGEVKAYLLKRKNMSVTYTSKYELLSHGVNLIADQPAEVQICFVYPAIRDDLTVVRWDPAGHTGITPGAWFKTDSFRDGPSMCAMVRPGTFALAKW